MNIFSAPLLGVFGLGGPELIIILVILLLLFGGAKLPALAKGLGQSIKEFKNAAKDEPKEEKKADNPPAAKPGNN
jgi:sec-independent protein translocase protein TatA